MSNILATLVSSAGALNAFDQVLQVTQNNVANASTPGFVKQRQSLSAMPFDPQNGLGGGVRAGKVESVRTEYAEQSVRRQTVLLGQAEQNVNSLTALQSVFDVSGNSGISKALNNLFQSFSAWAQSPTDAISRQNVVERATDVARSFQQTAADLTNIAADTEHQLQQSVDRVNNTLGQLRDYNAHILQGAGSDPGMDAQIHATLEELSKYVDITALPQDNGTVTVLLNGQTPLLMSDREYPLSYRLVQPETPPPVYPGARPAVHVMAADGSDVTALITTGQLGALLDVRNRMIASYLGDASQPGDLNVMAKQFADRVNQLLTAGWVADGDPPQPGIPLFTYDNTDAVDGTVLANHTKVARSLAVNSDLPPEQLAAQLAAIDPGPPQVGNGIPLALSALANPQKPEDEINGASYSEFYGDLAARAGSALNEATNQQQVQQSTVAQAKSLRQQLSGVSLDEEATVLIQFQRAYEANSRLITVLDRITEDLIAMLQP